MLLLWMCLSGKRTSRSACLSCVQVLLSDASLQEIAGLKMLPFPEVPAELNAGWQGKRRRTCCVYEPGRDEQKLLPDAIAIAAIPPPLRKRQKVLLAVLLPMWPSFPNWKCGWCWKFPTYSALSSSSKRATMKESGKWLLTHSLPGLLVQSPVPSLEGAGGGAGVFSNSTMFIWYK